MSLKDPRDRVIRVVGAAIVQDGRCLAVRRGPRMSLPGKWEFPGGKVEAGETPEAALGREITEELGLTIEVGEHLGQGRAGAPTEIQLDVFRARRTSGELELREHSDHRWLDADQLGDLDWAEADIPVLGAVRKILLAP